jgi:hypothetical protein
MASPTERSLKYLREQGYLAEVVERFNSFTKQRKDLWGWCDIIAIRKDEVLAVQVTSSSNVSARIHKIQDSDTVAKVREANIRIEVHGWGKNSKGRYVMRIEDIS